MAKAAAGVSRSSHSEAPAGRTEATARMYGRTISTMTPVTDPALRRSTVPTPRARGDRADHDVLLRQDPARPRAGGQGGADQAPPVLGGDERRGHDDHRD